MAIGDFSSPRALRRLAVLSCLLIPVSAQTRLMRWVSSESTTGSCVAALGDVNGDGVPDFLVGAPGSVAGGTVYVVSGASGTVLRTISGTGGQLGYSLASVSDLDGDGRPDILAGAPTGMSSGSPRGEARIWSSTTGSLLRTVLPPQAMPATPPTSFGATIAQLGDVTFDGSGEYLVASHGDRAACVTSPTPYSCPCAPLYSGQAVVYSGASGASLISYLGTNGDHFLAAAGRAGDLNGDGVSDALLISNGAQPASTACCLTPNCYTSPYQSSTVRAVSGATGLNLWTKSGVPASTNAAAIGDVNGDGRPDVVAIWVASASASDGISNVFVGLYSGTTGLELASSYESTAIGTAGAFDIAASIAPVGDIDTDGVPDFVVGFPARGIVRLYSGANLSVLWTVSGTPGYRFGHSVANIGDVNGDGTPEIAVGSPLENAVDVFSPRIGPSARSIVIGEGCASGNVAPRLGGTLPLIGTTARLTVSDAPRLFLTVVDELLLVGPELQVPLSVSAGQGFATPCAIYIDPASSFVLTTNSAAYRPWTVDIVIPNDPGLIGLSATSQAVAIVSDYGGNLLGAGVSNALRWIVGT